MWQVAIVAAQQQNKATITTLRHFPHANKQTKMKDGQFLLHITRIAPAQKLKILVTKTLSYLTPRLTMATFILLASCSI